MIKLDWDQIWTEHELGDSLHLVPVDDLIEHELDSMCPCTPYVEILTGASLDTLVAHFAQDGRP